MDTGCLSLGEKFPALSLSYQKCRREAGNRTLDRAMMVSGAVARCCCFSPREIRMRTFSVPPFILGLLLLAAGGASAADETQAIIDKAIKAHGGIGKLAKDRAMQTKSKGTIELAGGISYTQETSIQSGKFKDVMQLSVA